MKIKKISDGWTWFIIVLLLGAAQLVSIGWEIALGGFVLLMMLRYITGHFYKRVVRKENAGWILAYREELAGGRAALQEFIKAALEIVEKKVYATGAIHRLSEKFSGTYTRRLDGLEMGIQEVERLHAKRDNTQTRKKLEALHCSVHYIFLESLSAKAQQDLDNFTEAEEKARKLAEEVFEQMSRVVQNANFLRDHSKSAVDWELEVSHLTSIQSDLNRLEESIEQYQLYDRSPVTTQPAFSDHLRW